MDEMLAATARAEDRHFWFRALRRNAHHWLTTALGDARVTSILDCGTGTGRNLEWLSEIGPAIGVERSQVGLDIARAHRRRVTQGTVTALPFPDATADVVTSFDVLYCLSDRDEDAALREMYRVLRPNGIVLIHVAALDILHGSHSALTHEVRRYTPARLSSRLARTGFVIERLSFTNMLTFPLALTVRWLDRVRGRAAVASDADLRVPAWPMNELLSAALAAEGVLLRGMNLPIGSSLMCLARKGP